MAKPCAEESKEPKGSTGLDYILQWVLGVKCDPETLRGWIQSTIGEHAALHGASWQCSAPHHRELPQHCPAPPVNRQAASVGYESFLAVYC